ncbi:MAG: toll/interleukin-1 receptor domain-containing protein, partial [bacterium]
RLEVRCGLSLWRVSRVLDGTGVKVMPRKKPIVFISHIHEDGALASTLKTWIDKIFLGSAEVFVASDGSSIRGGDRWMEKIGVSLRAAKLVLLVITRQALERRWVYFEAGGAFFLGAKVIPLCVSNVTVADLPAPLTFLQSYHMSEHKHIKRLAADIADYLGLKCPEINARELSDRLDSAIPSSLDGSSHSGAKPSVNFGSVIDSLADMIRSAHQPLLQEYDQLLTNNRSLPSKVLLRRVDSWLKGKAEEVEAEIQRYSNAKPGDFSSPFLRQAHRKQYRNLRNARDTLKSFLESGSEELTSEIEESIRRELGSTGG